MNIILFSGFKHKKCLKLGYALTTYLADMSQIVENFLKNPLRLSALGDADIYYDYVAFFHLILVSKQMKKGFWVPGHIKPGIKICKELGIKFAKSDVQTQTITVGEKNSISNELTDALVKLASGRDTSALVCGNDDELLQKYSKQILCNSYSLGEFEEYPECCISGFVNNAWGDYEEMAEILGDKPENAQVINQNIRNAAVNEKVFKRFKGIMLEYADGRIKYPYVMHQACTKCLNDIKNSPTAKLNSKWKKVCEEEFPNLNLELMKGAAREHVQKSWEFNRNYREWCTLMQAMHG